MTFDLENSDPLPGDALRDLAANLLTPRYGRPIRDKLIAGKKVDLMFDFRELGRTRRLIVEGKDYSRNLRREDLAKTQEQIAVSSGFSQQYLSDLERAGGTPRS